MILSNVTIVNFDHRLIGYDVKIDQKSGLILEIKKSLSPESEPQYLIPGFIDLHIHGVANNDVMEGLDAIRSVSNFLLTKGVTTFLPTAMTFEWKSLLAILYIMSKFDEDSKHSRGLNLEGPFFGIARKGAHNSINLKTPTLNEIKDLLKASRDQLKRITVDPVVCDNSLITYLKNKGVSVALGHSNATYEQTINSIKAGANSACHLWNGMSGISHRDTGMAHAFLDDKHAYVELVVDLFHIQKPAINTTIKLVGDQRVILISDSVKIAFSDNHLSTLAGQQIERNGFKVTLVKDGTIAGSGISIYEAFLNILSLGYSLEQAVAMSSHNAAKHMKWNDIGYIKVGNKANLIVLDEKYQIKKIYFEAKSINIAK